MITSATKTPTVNSLNGYMKWVSDLRQNVPSDFLFRGLSNLRYQVEPALIRRHPKKEQADLAWLCETTQSLINDAKHCHDARDHTENFDSDLSLLTKLQYYGVATPFIDFTKDPLIALWFACQEEHKNSKRASVIALENDYHLGHADENMKITEILTGENLWQWHPLHHNKRMVVQKTISIIGTIQLKEDAVEKIIIGNKFEILQNLNHHGINKASLFPDFTGFAYWNQHDKPIDIDYFAKGVKAFQKKQWQSAEKYFTQALISNPKLEVASSARDLAKIELKNHLAQAQAPLQLAYQKADEDHSPKITTPQAEAKPRDAHFYHKRGNGKTKLENYKGALADYDQAIKIDPNHADSYHRRGNIKMQLEHYKEAISDYNHAIEIDQNHADFYHDRGKAKAELHHYKDAIIDYNQAIAIDPKHADSYDSRGNVKAEQHHYKEAMIDYNQALEIDPQHASTYGNRGFVKLKLGKNKSAIEDFTQAIRFNPQHPTAYDQRGHAQAKLKNYPEAIADLTQAVAIDPQNIEAYRACGLAKLKSGKSDEAAIDFEKARKLISEHTS